MRCQDDIPLHEYNTIGDANSSIMGRLTESILLAE